MIHKDCTVRLGDEGQFVLLKKSMVWDCSIRYGKGMVHEANSWYEIKVQSGKEKQFRYCKMKTDWVLFTF